MDEEKIIIDGVDVSECRFYQETLKAYNNGKISSSKGYGFCTHNIKGLNNAGCYAENFARCLNNNCYYKQLKRLEEKYNKMVKISEENLIKYEDLRLKNLALEKELQNYKFSQSLEMPYDIKINELEKENEKLKTALEEIKKLTVIGINASQCNCGLRALADDILQIISEVENDL